MSDGITGRQTGSRQSASVNHCVRQLSTPAASKISLEPVPVTLTARPHPKLLMETFSEERT